MSYELDAFVAHAPDLRRWPAQLSSVVLFELNQNLTLAPLTSKLLEQISSQLRGNFSSQAEIVDAWASDASRGTSVAFVSAFYHGAARDGGGQTASVWSDQILLQKDIKINSALRLLGAKASPPDDEFDSVGLGQFRRTESWVEAIHIRELVAVAKTDCAAVDAAIAELSDIA